MRRAAALVYGWGLSFGVLFLLREELWTKLGIPLLWSYDAPASPTLSAGLTAWLFAAVFAGGAGWLIALAAIWLGYFDNRSRVVTLVLFTVFGLTMVVPFLWMISTAFKTQRGAAMFKVEWLPLPARMANFKDVFHLAPFGRFYINSIFIACYETLGLIVTSSLAAYSFARLEFPGRDKIFLAYLATLMIPGAVISMPIFVVVTKLGWLDTYKAVILPGIFSAYGTFMLRQFFMSLPRDLEDAAKIDGCGYVGILRNIVIPLSKPALATLTIFTFMNSWGNFMWPLIIFNDPHKMPLPVGIQFFAMSELPDPNLLMAACMMMILPVIFIFILGQRYFVEGIQLGAIKG